MTFNTKIHLHKRVSNRENGISGIYPSTEPFATVWCKWQGAFGNQAIQAYEQGITDLATVMIRWSNYIRENLDVTCLIKKYNKLYEIITETDDLSPNEISTVIKGKTFEKYYTLKNNDTIKFRMRTYTDATQSKPLVERENYTLSGFPITDEEENINIESNYYYDDKGDLIKIIKRDFNSGEVVETYGLKEVIADTTIIYYRINTDTSYAVKRYIDNGKTIEITFDENQKPQNKITNYTANGFDIKVRESVKNGIITVDSIYQIKGKKVRSVSVSPENKSVTTLEYDGKGNITKEICKSKSDITISNEDLNEMIQRYKMI